MSGFDNWDNHVLPHGSLTKVASDLWVLTGTLPRSPLPRNMVIWRARGGGLVIHSAIAVDQPTLASILDLGDPEVMIVPNGLHRLDATVFKHRFPSMKVVAPEVSLLKVREKVPVYASSEEFLPKLGIEVLPISGLRPFELCYRIPLVDGGHALVLTDALFNLPRLPGVGGAILGVMGSAGFFGMTRIGRMMLLRDKIQFKAWLRNQAAFDDLRAILVAHGDWILDDCQRKLIAAAERLK